MSTGEEPKGTIAPESEHDDAYEEKAKIAADFKADAIEAENAEHNMTVIEAVKEYPMATFWAFVMSCTIVRSICTQNSRADVLQLTYPVDHGVLRRFLDGQFSRTSRVQGEVWRSCRGRGPSGCGCQVAVFPPSLWTTWCPYWCLSGRTLDVVDRIPLGTSHRV